MKTRRNISLPEDVQSSLGMVENVSGLLAALVRAAQRDRDAAWAVLAASGWTAHDATSAARQIPADLSYGMGLLSDPSMVQRCIGREVTQAEAAALVALARLHRAGW
jgi:hypothetical protein